MLRVSTLDVEFQESYGVTQRYTGKLVPRRSVDLGFELDGKVARIEVDEGDVVESGAALASLDAALLAAQLEGAQANREAALAKLAELEKGPREEAISAARAQLKAEEAVAERLEAEKQRVKRLLDQASVSEEAYDDVGFRATAAANRREAAREKLNELLAGTRPERIAAQRSIVRSLDAELSQLAIRIEKSRLTAPFDCTVARRLVDEGAAVAAGQPILRLVENAPWEARISLPVAVARSFAPTDGHELSIGGRTFRASLGSHLPELDPRTMNVRVVFRVEPNEAAVLFAGQLVVLSLPRTIESRGAWLPTTSLVKGIRGLWSCFAVVAAGEEDGTLFRVERRDLEVLHAEVDRAYVRGTLQPRDRILREGAHRVSNGQLVRLAPEE